MKKIRVLLILTLVIAGIIVAGCTSPSVPVPATTAPSTPTPTPSIVNATGPPFTLKDYYIKGNYSFQSETDVRTEQFRVPSGQPWGIEFHVKTLNDDPQYCWFNMNVTNIDTGNSDTYGFGRTNGYVKDQYIPMYNGGVYEIEMTGNLVSVNMNIGDRTP